MKFIHSKKGKAVSPILATVILVSIGLVSTTAIAGLVLGRFGSSPSSTLTLSNLTRAAVPSCGGAGAAPDYVPVGPASAAHPLACIENAINVGLGPASFQGSACMPDVAGSPLVSNLYNSAAGKSIQISGNTARASVVCDSTNIGSISSSAAAFESTVGGSIATRFRSGPTLVDLETSK